MTDKRSYPDCVDDDYISCVDDRSYVDCVDDRDYIDCVDDKPTPAPSPAPYRNDDVWYKELFYKVIVFVNSLFSRLFGRFGR